ncbi:MAG TPA: SMC-Scp complex subunit ScpB [Candidatus Thermoplasmatota archaeon]|nr:SMC-Scp complex subunit ScpB [Candidatus Thermoplasmatota archaeon]
MLSPATEEGSAPETAPRGGHRKIAEGLDPVRVVEAALFSAGKPLGLDEIAQNTGLTSGVARDALKALAKEYDARETALEIARAGDKWAMQLKATYAPTAERLAPMEIPVRVLKTLALIAYHQPLLQSDLVEMVGAKAYDHVHDLKEAGLVTKRVHDRSFLLVTTPRFPEYFGIPSTDREGIKRFLADRMGIKLPDDDGRGNKKLAAFEGEAPTETAQADIPRAEGYDSGTSSQS